MLDGSITKFRSIPFHFWYNARKKIRTLYRFLKKYLFADLNEEVEEILHVSSVSLEDLQGTMGPHKIKTLKKMERQ